MDRPQKTTLARAVSRPFHPLLFSIFPVLSLYSSNTGIASPAALVLPLAGTLAFGILVWSLAALGSREVRRSAIVASLVVVGLTVPGRFFSGDDLLQSRYWILMTTLLALVAIVALRARYDPQPVTGWLNVTSFFLVLIPLVASWIPQLTSQGHSRQVEQHLSSLDPLQSRPDIYLIVLDGYGRGDILESRYSLDNQPFLRALERRGFVIDHGAVANYPQTYLSLASLLNMEYVSDLPGVSEVVDGFGAGRYLLTEYILRSRVRLGLEQWGYRTVSFGTGFFGTNLVDADLHIDPDWIPNEFQDGYLSTLPIPLLLRWIGLRDQYDWHRARIGTVFSQLPGIVSSDSPPVFVFAHLLSPHPPFVFGSDGSPVQPDRVYGTYDASMFLLEGSRQEYLEGYRDQVQYLNTALIETIDDMLTPPSRPSVMIVMSDHGPGVGYDHESPERSDLEERFSILTAVRAVGIDQEDLVVYRSPVNLFRLILSNSLGVKVTPLPARSFYATYSEPLVTTEVTERVSGGGRGWSQSLGQPGSLGGEGSEPMVGAN